jgi:glycosyltransferase involved in cell wall biosynthesis
MTEPFSVLLPVYGRDRPEHLERSLRSVTVEQERPPSQVVIVQDGPVEGTLAETIEAFRRGSSVHTTIVSLQHNVGLGPALDEGLAACEYDVVARQDADDISLPQRFRVLLPIVEAGADLVGSGLLEFGEHEDDIVGRRTPPTEPDEIARYACFADPFNHPSVVYRASAVWAVGGYLDLPLMEDYWLFARMIQQGAIVRNVAEPLVLYRVGAGAYARRGGLALLRSEIELQRRMHESGFTSTPEYLRNLAIRGGYRLVPEGARRLAYRRVFGAHVASAAREEGVGILNAQPYDDWTLRD